MTDKTKKIRSRRTRERPKRKPPPTKRKPTRKLPEKPKKLDKQENELCFQDFKP